MLRLFFARSQVMRVFLLLIFLCLSAASQAQGNLKISVRKEGGNTVFYADNEEWCPVSVQLKLETENFEIDGFGDGIFVVPAGAGRYRLFGLTRMEKGKTSYSYTYKAVFGDVRQVSWDRNYLYDLPYSEGRRVRVEQGYNRWFSHRNENSLDFNLPEGSEVRAARAGTVVAVVQEYSQSCLREECKKMVNHILVYHDDGTLADYSHLQYQGARVTVGDRVATGQLLGISGHTGYTRGPHLHFSVFLPGFASRRTLTTRFRINKGDQTGYLREGLSYLKKYP